jgi:hypothetical protein
MNVSELAMQAAVLKALLDEVSARVKAAKDDALAAFTDTGTTGARSQLPDGTTIATVTKAGGESKSAYVLNENTFQAWVMANHPEEMELVVRPGYKEKLLDAAAKAGEAVTKDGERLPGVAVKDTTPYVSIRFKPGGKEAVAAAWRAGELPGVDIVTPAQIGAGEGRDAA